VLDDLNFPDYPDWTHIRFKALLRGVTAGTGNFAGLWLYSWTAQWPDPSTSEYLTIGGLQWDNNLYSPAIESNNRLVTTPRIVAMKYLGTAFNPIFEFTCDSANTYLADLYTSTLQAYTRIDNVITCSDAGAMAEVDGVSPTVGTTILYNPMTVDGGIWKVMFGGGAVFQVNVVNATDNGGGLIRIMTDVVHPFLSGQQLVAIDGIQGTTEANGLWTVNRIMGNMFDLVGSTFTNPYVSGGTAFAGQYPVLQRVFDMSGVPAESAIPTPGYSGTAVSGALVQVGPDGSHDNNTLWVLITPNPITVNITPLAFAMFSSSAGGGGTTLTVCEIENGAVGPLYNPTTQLQLDVGEEGTLGQVTNSGAITTYRPWDLMVESTKRINALAFVGIGCSVTPAFTLQDDDTTPPMGLRKCVYTITVTDVDTSPLTVDGPGGSVSGVTEITFINGANISIGISGSTPHATVTIAGSAGTTMTVRDDVSWTTAGVPWVGVGLTFTVGQPISTGRHNMVTVSDATTLIAHYPIYVVNSSGSLADLYLLLAGQTFSGYVDHGENNVPSPPPAGSNGIGFQDYNGIKCWHDSGDYAVSDPMPAAASVVGGTARGSSYVTIDGNYQALLPISLGTEPNVAWTATSPYIPGAGNLTVVDGAFISYYVNAGAGTNDTTGQMDILSSDVLRRTTVISLLAGKDRKIVRSPIPTSFNFTDPCSGQPINPSLNLRTDSAADQLGYVLFNKPFYTSWHTSGVCQSNFNGRNPTGLPDGQAADDESFNASGASLDQSVGFINLADTRTFDGGRYVSGAWQAPGDPCFCSIWVLGVTHQVPNQANWLKLDSKNHIWYTPSFQANNTDFFNQQAQQNIIPEQGCSCGVDKYGMCQCPKCMLIGNLLDSLINYVSVIPNPHWNTQPISVADALNRLVDAVYTLNGGNPI
jgi:hypothetical protein